MDTFTFHGNSKLENDFYKHSWNMNIKLWPTDVGKKRKNKEIGICILNF